MFKNNPASHPLMPQEILIRRIEIPEAGTVESDIDWLARSLGFASPRDREETALKVFHLIVEGAVHRAGLTSEQLALELDLTRAAVLHHVKNYIAAGLIRQDRTLYTLRTRSLLRTIEEVELDTQRIFSDLKKIAREVDERLGLVTR